MNEQPPLLALLVGAPGAGKSTAVREGTHGYQRTTFPKDDYPARQALTDNRGNLQAVELGKAHHTFPGTDTLPMDVINKAETYLQHNPDGAPLVIAEGARLSNLRFMEAAHNAGYEVYLIHLDNPLADEWRWDRARRIGKRQKEQWAKGRDTAARNLVHNAPEYVHTLTARHPEEAAGILRQLLTGLPNTTPGKEE